MTPSASVTENDPTPVSPAAADASSGAQAASGADGEPAGLIEKAAGGQRARRVGQARFGAAQTTESSLQQSERRTSGGARNFLRRPVEVRSFERRCQPFVEPGRNAAGGEAAND